MTKKTGNFLYIRYKTCILRLVCFFLMRVKYLKDMIKSIKLIMQQFEPLEHHRIAIQKTCAQI